MKGPGRLILTFILLLTLSFTAYALDMEFLTRDVQSSVGNSVNLSVSIMYDNGTPVNDSRVNFTTDLGILNQESVLSDSSGIAEVSLNSSTAGTAHINASSGGTYNLTNITFYPLSADSILVDADKYENVAGSITNITFTPVDVFDNTNCSEKINLDIAVSDYSGSPALNPVFTINYDKITTLEISRDENGDAYWNVSEVGSSPESDCAFLSVNSTISGNITITSTTGSASNYTELVILPGEPDRITAVYNDECTVNTSHNMYVRVYDRYANPTPEVDLTFSVTSPENTVYNSPVEYSSASLEYYSGITDASGKLSNTFTTDKKAGSNIITISVVSTSLTGNITIEGLADEIHRFFLTYTPEYALSNNQDTYTLSARPVDQFMNPILPLTTPIKEQVRFTTDSGSSVLVPLNSQGRANTIVGPTPYIESLSVSATYRNESGYTSFTNNTTLYFTAGPLEMIDIYSVPNAVLSRELSGNHESSIVLVALDEWGHSLPNVHVTFNNSNATVGTLTINEINSTHINATTDSEGRIYGTFTGNVSGNTTITAASEDVNSSTNISVKAEPFMSVNLNVQPTSVTSGSLINVTTIISIEGELPIVRPAASAMLVLDRSGSMDPDYYAGTPLDVVLVIDRSGSMSGQPIIDARDAAKEFTDNLVSNSEAGVVSFASSSGVDMDMTLLNSYDNKAAVKSAIDSIDDDGMTAMGEGMADANDLLINHGRSDTRKVMIVLTDGETNSGDDRDGEDAIAFANANGVTIYTIGLGSSLDEALLRHIASETGGTYYNAPDSSDLSEIYNTIAQELSDYDISDVEYGVEGFTPYDYTFQESLGTPSSIEGITLRFEGYDLDTVFDAGSAYGGSSAGECLIQINGNNFELIPSYDTGINEQWDDYEYDISAYVQPGINTITFYDYHDYETGSNWNNRVRNVEVFWNDTKIASYSDDTELYAGGYDCSVNLVEPFETDIFINETINDLKVQLDWEDAAEDFYLQLTSPSGKMYGLNKDTTGYYPNGDTSEYIWIQPLSYLYPDDDSDTVETGYWTITVMGTSTDDFTITTFIDKKSAAKLSSHAFMSSFDESRGDKAGLALYSFEDVVESNNQTSYLLDDSSWVGYFTAGTDGFHTFNITWDDTSSIDAYLYDGIEVLDSSGGTGACEVSHLLSEGKTYHLEVVKGAGTLTDTRFTINVSTSEPDSFMTAYYDSSGGGGTPKYRVWDGLEWSTERSANYVGGSPYYVVLESSPLNSEIIMATADSNNDVNVQVWDSSSWGSVNQLSGHLYSYEQRGFDLKYEQVSGDAIVAYMDTDIDDATPRYRVWDGNSWSPDNSVDDSNSGAGDTGWIRLEANPYSDEMVLVTLDNERDLRAQVWDGDSWGNVNSVTNSASAIREGWGWFSSYSVYQCFDVAYEQTTGRAMVVWADSDGHVNYCIWDGNSWSSEYTIFDLSDDICWIKTASDPNTDNILLATQDNGDNIHIAVWDGSTWSGPTQIENNVYEYERRSVDVAFEQSSGEGVVVWGDSSSTPKYRTWDGFSWSDESSASDLGGNGYTRWVQLTPDPESNDIFLMTSDGNYDLNIQKWDGFSWSIVTELETSSTRYYECFDMVFNELAGDPEITSVSWNQWTASVTSTLENDSLSHLENAIGTMTADGLTSIDEGMYAANNELSSVDGNSTMVIMTDGLDNAGYHSLLEEAHRAKENNTIIYTVGFGNDESEVDPVLAEVAEITGGEYYFAPNSSVLKDIFQGIAMQITNFSAGGPVLSVHVPYNYITPLSVAKATYIPGSSNSTTGNATLFVAPTAPATGNAEPTITTSGTRSALEWQMPTMGSGDKWGIWYQMRVDGAGYVPIIMPSSTVTYTDLDGENVTVYVPASGSASLGGNVAGVLTYALGSLEMVPDDHLVLIDNSSRITLTVEDVTGNSSFAYVILETDLGYFNNYQNPVNITVVGSDTVDFSSAIAGKAHITARAYNINNVSDMLTAKDMLVVRPKGMITIS